MATEVEVWQVNRDLNGREAADKVARKVYAAAAKYATMQGYNLSGRAMAAEAKALLVLDVLKLAYDGEFEGLKAE
jgi:hypothetical protein